MFQSTGTLHYEITNTDPPYKLILAIDPSIAAYYHSTIPKVHRVRRQMYAPHISVIRKEAPPNLLHWNRYEGQEVSFEYEHNVRWDNVYYWIDAYSLELERIRAELGLHNAPLHPATYHTPMPEGYAYTKRFHITIGNTKQQ